MRFTDQWIPHYKKKKVKGLNLPDCKDVNTVKQIVDDSVLITSTPSLNNLTIEYDPCTQETNYYITGVKTKD